ncbi:unnamed protein product [Phytophthora fragariaefolia]|uniref:Unnamed protein product n=1 Tax=Phytophthora fragariaefolia TaxID=1490495 RepID=A0A9W6Y5A6_9STRA|nr:unnamed protein product [Phytophthora fragariaefolia]
MFTGKESSDLTLVVGSNCVIREHVTVHGSTSYSDEPTSVGDDCWLLCGAHVAHDAQLGRRVVVSNNVCIAGHVSIGDGAIIGGQVGLKQHVSVGRLAMVGGQSAVDGDVLPYGLVVGNRAKLAGLNLVGLRRTGVSRSNIKLLLRVYRYIFGAPACKKTGFAPALEYVLTIVVRSQLFCLCFVLSLASLAYRETVVERALEAKEYLVAEGLDHERIPLVHEMVRFLSVVLSSKTTQVHSGTMGKKAMTLDTSGDGTKEDTAKRSPKAKGRPRKSVMRQHRKASLRAERAEEPLSPQAESPLLENSDEVLQQSTLSSKDAKSIRRKGRLSSSKRDNNNGNGEVLQNQQSPTPSGRRSSIMSWRSRNSTASIVEDAPPASCPLSCQPSACFIGSLNGSITETHLPLLSKHTKARLNALKTQQDQRQLEITIERSDELPFGAYSHPQVCVHIVDRCTGRALCPPQITSEAKFCDGLSNNDCTRSRFESVSTQDEDDKYHKPSAETDYRHIAWGFFHTITSKGNPTIDSFVLPYVDENVKGGLRSTGVLDVCGLRVRLFEYQVITWMDNYQARLQWGWRKNHLTMPAVFLQYQKRSRVSAPSTLHVQLRAVRAANSPRQAVAAESNETIPNAEISDEQKQNANLVPGGGDNLEPPQTDAIPNQAAGTESKAVSSDSGSSDKFDVLEPCKRNYLEPCLIPQRVLYSLPTGKKGCSAVCFSPCGRYLAASVSPELGEFVVKVYSMTSAELYAVGRGHRGIIYSLQWSTHSSGHLRLLSASSDGTVRLWKLPSLHSSIPKSSPRATSARRVVLTGASDGCLRFRKESSVPNGQPEHATLKVSSVAVHTVCAENKTGRVFCGDAKGDIMVWRPIANSSMLGDFELIKTIITGQTSITSLELHPRKAHLLVHTQPNALFQYELRSYLLLNKSYAGVTCESLLVKSTFSPDGKLVISGSEDGVPRLFTSLHGEQLERGVWGTHFFHDFPLLDVSWSPVAHMAALCSYGGNNPIVVLCSYRNDKEAIFTDESATMITANSTTTSLQQLAIDAFRGGNQSDVLSGDHTQRLQRALERRQKRLQAKVNEMP